MWRPIFFTTIKWKIPIYAPSLGSPWVSQVPSQLDYLHTRDSLHFFCIPSVPSSLNVGFLTQPTPIHDPFFPRSGLGFLCPKSVVIPLMIYSTHGFFQISCILMGSFAFIPARWYLHNSKKLSPQKTFLLFLWVLPQLSPKDSLLSHLWVLHDPNALSFPDPIRILWSSPSFPMQSWLLHVFQELIVLSIFT